MSETIVGAIISGIATVVAAFISAIFKDKSKRSAQSTQPVVPEYTSIEVPINQKSAKAWKIGEHISLAFSLISLIATFGFGMHACQVEPQKELSYNYYYSEQYLDRGILTTPDLEIKFRDIEIDSYSVTTIEFVNSGNQIIDGSDIPELAPLNIKVMNDCKLLNVSIGSVSNESCGFKLLATDDHHSSFTFDYLNPGDTAFVNLIHSGSFEDLEVSGAVKGGDLSKSEEGVHFDNSRMVGIATCFFALLFCSLGIMLYVAVSMLKLLDDEHRRKYKIAWAGITCMFIVIGIVWSYYLIEMPSGTWTFITK